MQNKIIAELYLDHRYKRITRNVCKDIGYHYTDDMHSEIVLRIIEEGDDLTEIRNLFYYFHAYAVKWIRYNYTLAKVYGFNHNRLDRPYEFIEELDYSEGEESEEDKLSDKFIDNKEYLLADKEEDTWRDKYEKELFKLYLKHGSYREVQKAVNIPFRSVADALKSFKEKIKKQL